MKSARAPWADQTDNRADFKPCNRCGIIRRHKKGGGKLCADCVHVLSQGERKIWAA